MEQSISKSNSRKFHLADKMGKLILLVFLLSTTYASAQVKKAFTPRYDETIKGDVTIIANNMLSAHKTNNYNLTGDNQDSNNRVYVDIDSDPTTFNSSSATLNDPNPSLNCKEFVKAYLYWAASDKEAGGVSQNADSWNHNKVKLMLPGSSTYATITADEVLYRGRTEHFHNDPYICVKDITSDVVSLTNPYGKYQVGNVQATYGGLEPHGGGNYGVAGGWQIVFVYQSTDLLTRNITLFDGYAHVDNGATTDFNVDGFLSIPSGPVKADIILGSIEGDRVLNGDSFQIKKPDNTWQKISTPLRGQDNFFSSTISIDGAHFVNRNPASTNTLGYDASIFELSNPGNTLIANNQTSTTLRATSGQESYGLYLVGFSIEVYEPSLGALKFTTSPLNSTYNPGEIATLSMSIENSGNDNIRNLEISTILPVEVDFNSMDPLPDGVTYTFDTDTRELKFFVADGYIDTEDSFNIDFKVDVREQCYFLETACSANFSVQATATFTGEINTTPQSTNSSGTLDECGFGNFDPSIVAINQPAQVNWSSIANELDRTVSCDDAASLNAAQSLEPATEFCDFTLNKTDGAFVATPGCDAEGTYTNTWTFTDACGRVSDTFTQVITIEDNTDPNFNEALPADTVAAYDNIPSPTILTANDTCDTNPQVNLVETYNGDNSGTTYTIIRTWTASDCAGNTAEHTQNIYVTENGDPIGLAINDVSINENAGTATFNVALTGVTTSNFSVDFASANSSAIAPGDFIATTGTLPFNGQHGEIQNVVVTINDDAIIEDTESYTIELSSLTTSEIGINDASGLGTILDNDSATVSINDLDVNENAGVINVQVVLSGDVEESFTIDYATANGSALAGLDYNNVNDQLTFPANSTNGSFQNIAITINDDNLIEITENFLVNLSNITASGNVTIADNQANINITDNDAITGTGISFTDTDIIVTEGTDAFAIFTVTLTGNIAENVTVDYTTNEGTALNPSDFVTTAGTLEFTPTVNSLDIQVPITDNDVIEPTEAFTVVLSNINSNIGIGFVDGNSTNTANGTIYDNDSDPSLGVQFNVTSVDVNEDAGTVTLDVVLNADVQ
ncbi:MAG: Calx-beta domain-containing protein, partial [Maribacter sp.]